MFSHVIIQLCPNSTRHFCTWSVNKLPSVVKKMNKIKGNQELAQHTYKRVTVGDETSPGQGPRESCRGSFAMAKERQALFFRSPSRATIRYSPSFVVCVLFFLIYSFKDHQNYDFYPERMVQKKIGISQLNCLLVIHIFLLLKFAKFYLFLFTQEWENDSTRACWEIAGNYVLGICLFSFSRLIKIFHGFFSVCLSGKTLARQ